MVIQAFVLGPLQNNVYVVADEAAAEAALIDPGMESEPVLDYVRDRGWRLATVINTHAHFDHVFADVWFQEQTGARLLMHADDAPLLRVLPRQATWFGCDPPGEPTPDRLLQEREEVVVGALRFTVLHTPGHTPGGICLYGHGALFSGDTLFAGSIGRTDLPGGDYDSELRSIRDKLFPLPDDTIVYPGHGPQTTLGREKATNPFLAGI